MTATISPQLMAVYKAMDYCKPELRQTILNEGVLL
jgi:hypothetical protein